MLKHYKFATLTSAAVLLMTTAGCGQGSSDDSDATDTPTITLGLARSMTASPGYVAAAKGYFKDFGVNVKIEVTTGGSAGPLPLLATGAYTVVASTFSAAVFNALAKDDTIDVLGDTVTVPKEGARPEALLVDQEKFDAGKKTAAAWKGGTFAIVGAGGVAEFEAAEALKSVGLTTKDTKIVVLEREQTQAALQNNSIVGAWCGEPQCTQLKGAKVAQPIESDQNVGNDPFTMFVNAGFAKAHPKEMSAFVAGWFKAAKELDGDGWNDPETRKIISKATGVPTAAISKIPKPSYYIADAEKFAPDPQFVADFETYLRQQGLLQYSGKLNLDDHYNPKLVADAVKLLDK